MRFFAGMAAIGAAVAALLGSGWACGGGGSPDGGNNNGGGAKDLAFIRQSRGGFGSTEPEGLRNLEVLIGTTRATVTKATTLSASICQSGCLLSLDRKRVVFLRNRSGGGQELVSVPVDATTYEAQLSNVSVLNTKPLIGPQFVLIPGSDRVVFAQEETAGAQSADGGATPPTFSVVSVPVGGGSMLKYRTGTFLRSSPFGVAPDGSRVLFVETQGAANVINLFSIDAASPPSTPRPILNWMLDGSAEFGGEIMTQSFDGASAYVATQLDGDKVIIKVATNGSTTAPPPNRRLGPTECAAAADNEVCMVQSPLYISRDGRTLYFLGGREVGVEIVSQLYALDTSLSSAPRALSNFTTEVLSLAMNRDRTRVIWATQAEAFRKSNAIFMADFDGNQLKNTQRVVDDPNGGLSNHYQEGYFLE